MFSQMALTVVRVGNLYWAAIFQALSSATSLGSKPLSPAIALGLLTAPSKSLVRFTFRCIS